VSESALYKNARKQAKSKNKKTAQHIALLQQRRSFDTSLPYELYNNNMEYKKPSAFKLLKSRGVSIFSPHQQAKQDLNYDESTRTGDLRPARVNNSNSSNMDMSNDYDQVDPSTETDVPLLTADEIATALQRLPDLFFHRIASRVLEVGMNGDQLMELVYSIQPAESSTTHLHELSHKKTVSDEEVKASSSSKREIEQSVEEGQEISRMAAGAHENPFKKQKVQTSNDVSIPSATQASCQLPTPEELAAVLQSGPGEFYQQLASQIQDAGIDGKQLKEFVFSVLPRIPVNVIMEHMLPLLDRASFNRLCSAYKEIHNASRKMTPPWPQKRLQAGSSVWSTAFSPDGEVLACGCKDGIIHIWDRKDGRCTRLEGHTGFIPGLSFSPNGKTLASGCVDGGTIRLWNLTDNSYRILKGHTSGVLSVPFAPNGPWLASGSSDGSIRIWHVIDGNCAKVLRDERLDFIWSLAFSPDGTTLASGGSGVVGVVEDGEVEDIEVGVILLWDLSDENDSSTLLFQSQESGSEIMSIAYSPDGQYLAAGGTDLKVQLWNVANRSLQRVFKGHKDCIRSVCFSPNGKILASASDDWCVRLWDVQAKNGGCLVNLSKHHRSLVLSVSFSPCGRTLVSGCFGGNVQLWNPFEESKRDKKVDWEKIYRLWNYSS
jgi:WD40 repeat protein